MKRTLLFLISGLCIFSLQAQHETLFDDWRDLGGFGGPIMEIGAINKQTAAYWGGGGAISMKNIFFGGYGLGNNFADYTIEEGVEAGRYNIRHKHAGLWFGYSHKPEKLFHLYTSLRLGWGNARLSNEDRTISDRIFAMTPEVGLEVNLYRFVRLAGTIGYRWTNGISRLPGLSNRDFSSPVGVLTLRFGVFGDNDWDNWDNDTWDRDWE
jgi:hypothetical protein